MSTAFEDKVESALKDAGVDARTRLTPDHIDSVIDTAMYHHFPGTTLMVCAIKLKNGACVVGEAACADAANFRENVGKMVAFQHARQKIWDLEGYLLREKLSHKK